MLTKYRRRLQETLGLYWGQILFYLFGNLILEIAAGAVMYGTGMSSLINPSRVHIKVSGVGEHQGQDNYWNILFGN